MNALFLCGYLYKQMFCVPGSLFLNVLGGALFGLWPGFPLLCLLSSVGATLAYLLAQVAGKPLIERCIPRKLAMLQEHLQSSHNSFELFFTLLSLRVFPLTPQVSSL